MLMGQNVESRAFFAERPGLFVLWVWRFLVVEAGQESSVHIATSWRKLECVMMRVICRP